MAVRGSILKNEIAQKILETFPNSFLYNDGKEIRINGVEDGIELQIKCVLTCAKIAVENDNGIISPEEITTSMEAGMNPPESNEKVVQEPSTEEKERLKTLLDRLGL